MGRRTRGSTQDAISAACSVLALMGHHTADDRLRGGRLILIDG
jgi:hypothetical protein